MPQLLIVGDFLSNKDDGVAWSDGLGRMYKGFLRQQGIEPRECAFLNVFDFVPRPRAIMSTLLGPKKQGIPNVKPVKAGGYVLAQYAPNVAAFRKQVCDLEPNLILACGDIPTWACATGNNPIDRARGRIAAGNTGVNGIKVLPTYAPSQVASDWTMRPVVLADMEKARREMQFPELRRPQRFLHIEPSLEEMEDYYHQYLKGAPYIQCDIESKGKIITCVGFASSVDRALVVPFYSEAAPQRNYWPTPLEEKKAWQFVARMLTLPQSRVCGQNFQFDMQYLWREMGIPCPQFADDTMLMHHVLQPEMRKGLGFLASVYTDEVEWKGMHKVSAADKTAKRGDGE